MAESQTASRPPEKWSSRLGVILAVAGSAVGLGNFLRFPGQAAQYGGGAFMIAYFIAFLLIGLPICWAEWSMGRSAGQKGFNSCPGIFNYVARHPWAKYAGVIGVIIPVVIYMYYVTIEAWCLGYAINFAAGTLEFASARESGAFFDQFIGAKEDGSGVHFGLQAVGGFLLFVFIANFTLVYRGLSKGIEWFCTYAMPTLVVMALIILIRVLTLGSPDPAHADRTVLNGLGFMWNPNKQFLVVKGAGGHEREFELVGPEVLADPKAYVAGLIDGELATADGEAAKALGDLKAGLLGGTIKQVTLLSQLKRPQLWLAAAGQIFFSLSVGFGIILTYASYLKKNDDVVLSGLSACAANEFCEVGLGGLITLPAAVAFLGVSGVAGMGTFGLGFNVLPMVFANMPAGNLFGFLFFFLLFLAAITSSLSMLQPGIAFLEEAMGIGRKMSVTLLGFITAVGCCFVVYFSQGMKALDTLDFWVGTFLIYVLATIQVVLFSWVIGARRAIEQAHVGATIRIPGVFGFILQWITPLMLLAIFLIWLVRDVIGVGGTPSSYITDLAGPQANSVARMSVALVVLVGATITLILARARIYKDELKRKPDPDENHF